MARRKGRFGVILREERIPLPALDNYLLRLVERGKGGAITFDETVMVVAPSRPNWLSRTTPGFSCRPDAAF